MIMYYSIGVISVMLIGVVIVYLARRLKNPIYNALGAFLVLLNKIPISLPLVFQLVVLLIMLLGIDTYWVECAPMEDSSAQPMSSSSVSLKQTDVFVLEKNTTDNNIDALREAAGSVPKQPRLRIDHWVHLDKVGYTVSLGALSLGIKNVPASQRAMTFLTGLTIGALGNAACDYINVNSIRNERVDSAQHNAQSSPSPDFLPGPSSSESGPTIAMALENSQINDFFDPEHMSIVKVLYCIIGLNLISILLLFYITLNYLTSLNSVNQKIISVMPKSWQAFVEKWLNRFAVSRQWFNIIFTLYIFSCQILSIHILYALSVLPSIQAV